jgi:hypothetical protein
MLALGLVLNPLGIGLFCWLMFELAVYALLFSSQSKYRDDGVPWWCRRCQRTVRRNGF